MQDVAVQTTHAGPTRPHDASAGYIWREAHDGGWYLAHDTAEIDVGARIGAGARIGPEVVIGANAPPHHWRGER